MQAIIFADRRGTELTPLCDAHCPALLSVANRPLLHYTIEDLAEAGVTEMLIVVSDDVSEIREACGDGTRWGVAIRYFLSRGEEGTTALLARLRSELNAPFLAARGDVLRVSACTEFLAAVPEMPGPVVSATSGNTPIGLCLVREWPADLPDLDWPPTEHDPLPTGRIRLRRPIFAGLMDLADYHRAALRLAVSSSRRDAAASLPGIEIEPGLRVDRLARVAPASRVSGSAVVGAHAWVHGSVRLSGSCVIGHDCYIDRNAVLHNSIVLPGSYVGEGLQIDNAIVVGDTLVRPDLGAIVRLDGAQLLSRNRPTIGAHLSAWPERMIAGGLLVASAPLWPVALLAGLIAAPRAPLRLQRIRTNRRGSDGRPASSDTRTVWRFAARAPLLRDLPLLWPVLRGDLRLFGARPLPASDDCPAGRAGNKAAAGLLGPAQLYLPADAPEEELELNERAFAMDDRRHALPGRLAAAARLLFSRRAWLGAPPAPRGH